jgi:hypothetical protein
MKKTIEDIQWRAPWRPLTHPLDLPALQNQFRRELAEGHPLWDRDAKVVGRRVDSDDVLVVCSDGAVATVHLDWATGPHRFPDEYPSVVAHESLTEFQKVVDEDALEYGEDND